MESGKHRIFAVTLNWNSFGVVCECIQSLQRSEQTVEKIVVVDNASADGSGKRLAQEYANDHRIAVVRNNSNEGFARAVNRGIALAMSEGATHVFLLNNDAEIDKNCLTELIKGLSTDINAGAASPTVFYKNRPTLIWQAAGYFRYLRANVVVPEKNRKLEGARGGPREVTFLSGCALLMTEKMVTDIGLFDTDFFFYGEDVEFSLRAIRKGYKLLYVPSASAWHQIDDVESSRSSPYVMYHRARSAVLLYRKCFKWLFSCYAILIHLVLYTPYRLWQCRLSEGPFRSFGGWIRGTIDALFSPPRNWVG